jgi:hypothetical protein
MGFTIEEKAFLLDYFRNKVKLVLLCTPLHRKFSSRFSRKFRTPCHTQNYQINLQLNFSRNLPLRVPERTRYL